MFTFKDALTIARPGFTEPTLQEFRIRYRIEGELILRAPSFDDAYRASLLYTKEDLGRKGELEMDDPEPSVGPRSGVLEDLSKGKEA